MIITLNYPANRLLQMNSGVRGSFAHQGLKQKIRPAAGRLSPAVRLVLAVALLVWLVFGLSFSFDCSIFVSNAYAADTGWQSPGSCSNVDRSSGVAWSNPENAVSSNESPAIADLNDYETSDWLRCTSFGFSVPAGSTIDGIEVAIERESESGSRHKDSSLHLRTSSSQVGDENADTSTWWPTTDTTANYGGAAEDWNAGLTVTDINDSGFGVDLSAIKDSGAANALEARVDHIQIRVTYTAPPPLTSVSNAPSPNTVSDTSTHTVAFTTVNDLPSGGDIVVTFPDDFGLTDVETGAESGSITSNTMGASTFTVSRSGQELTITPSVLPQTADIEDLIIADITNIDTADTTYTVTVKTQDSGGTPINGPTTSSTFTIVCGAYSYRRSIVIDHEKVGMDNSGSLPATGFPVLVSLTGTWLRTTTEDPTNGRITDAQGDDIIFTAADGETDLYHEIEAYDGTATGGSLTAWVGVDSLSKASDTTIYMYYGNACVTSATEDPDNVWDADFKGVWHLEETSGDHDDSAGTNDGTRTGNVKKAGKIADGQDFDGTNDWVDIDHADIKTSLGTANAVTVSAWVKHDFLDPDNTKIEDHVRLGDQVVLRHDGNGGNKVKELHFYIETSPGVGQDFRPERVLSDDVWSHVVGTWDGTTQKVYVDGQERDREDRTGTLLTPTDGKISNSTDTMDGVIDEVRISATARSDDWVRTEYNNQSDTTIASGYFIKSLGSEDSDFLALTDHAAGQETDAFTGDSSVSGAELFAFQLSNDSDSAITVSAVVFPLSAVSGIVETDFTESELKIYEDTNGDGTISGESTTVGGTGDVNAGVTTITFGTDFNIPADTTVNYILKGNVSNLAANNTLTIDLAPGNVSLTPSGTTLGFAAASATHTADDPLTFDGHAAGQQPNAFFGISPVTGAQLFGFQLTNNSTGSLTVDQVVFPLSAVSGVVEADFTESELKIYEDTNGDGTIAAGESTTVGVTGDVNAGVTTLTFDPVDTWTLSAGATVNYILKGDVKNLASNDTLTIDLAPGNVTLTPVAAVGGSAAASITHAYCGKFQYAYRRTIVINYDKVGADNISGTLPATGYPVLVSLSGNWLKTTSVDAANGRIEHDDGYDIVFRKSDGINLLDHEIEEYDDSNGKLVAWVRIDSLSKTADTTFYMDYGNVCASVDPSDPASVWDVNFKGVWHLNDGDSTATDFYRDSTANNEHGTLTDVSGSSTAATGQIGGAYDFEGDADYIQIDNFSQHFSNQMTLSGWVKVPAAHGDYDGYFGIRPAGVNNQHQFYVLQQKDSYNLEFRFRNSGGDGYGMTPLPTVTEGTWTYFALTYDGEDLIGYINTQSTTSIANPRGVFIRPDFPFRIGSDGSTNWLDGIVDEVRFSDTVRDSDWITTEFNNQDDLDAQGVSNFGAGSFFKSLSDETDLCAFAYRRSILIDRDNVGTDNSGTLPATGFPVLVSLAGDWLKTTTEDPVNGRIASADGDDIVFRESDGTNGLYHEIEEYDGTTGTLVAWVRIDSLSKSADTTIYMYYGNFCIDSATEDPANVWDSSYAGVWHLHDDFLDSASNNNGTNNGSTNATGMIADGQDFNGTSDYLSVGDAGSGIKTVSFWIQADDITTRKVIDIDGTDQIEIDGSNNILATDFPANTIYVDGSAASAVTTSWHHVTITVTSGEVDASALDLGRVSSSYFDGKIDEVRISSTVRSADWIKTEYNNQNSTLGKMYWASSGGDSIRRSDADGSNIEDLVTANLAFPSDVALNISAGKIYWTEYTNDVVRRSNLDGSSVEEIGVGDVPQGIDIDVSGGKIYWATSGADDRIRRADLDGSNVEDVVTTAESKIGLALDLTNSKIYWTTGVGSSTDEILRADLDGTNVETLISSGLNDPYHIALDVSGGKMYWMSSGDDRIRRADLDGTNVEDLVTSGLEGTPSRGIALDLTNGKIYWGNKPTDKISSSDLDGTNVVDLATGLSNPEGIALIPGSPGDFYSMGAEETSFTTAISLLSFTATGENESVQVAWETASETGNLGFYLYRADSTSGPYRRITDQLIAGLNFSVEGRVYTYQDTDVTTGQPYFYKLEDLDLDGQRTFHGPVGVNWDGAGAPAVAAGDPDPAPWEPGGEAGPVTVSAADEPVYKIMVAGEGLYRLSRDFLAGQSVALERVDLSRVRLYHHGRETAIWVHDENDDTVFDAADHITFYALPVAAEFAKYSADNVYWLTTGAGENPVKRMAAVDSAPDGAALAAGFTVTVRREQDQYYYPAAPGADGFDRWLNSTWVVGAEIAWQDAGQPITFTLDTPGVAGADTLTVALLGTYNTDHQVDISVNGGPVQTFSWSGIAFYEAVIEDAGLVDGLNAISLTCKTGLDALLLDWLAADYTRNFAADSEQLELTSNSPERFLVTGFAGSELLALDITDPENVSRSINFLTGGNGPYSLEFTPPNGAAEDRTYLVMAADNLLTPRAVTADAASNLTDSANGADYILITHRNLGWDANGDPYAWLTDLLALRQAQGHRVTAVDLTDIYDEFAFGLATPAAIRDFLAYAVGFWTAPAPQYVLLVGDATYDYKDNWGYGAGYDVPSYTIFTREGGETVTDNWFAAVSGGDALPDLYIGRLPAATAAEAGVMTAKIVSYETAVNTKTWQQNILLVADNVTRDEEAVFENMNDDAAAVLPAGLQAPFKAYLDAYDTAAALTADIQAQINGGSLLVNYSGHASVQIWAEERIFDAGDVPGLSNAGRYPVIISMSCLSGYFAYPAAWNYPSLSEALMRAADKGAVGMLVPTGQTNPIGQHILNTALFEAIFTADIRQLGAAVGRANQVLLQGHPSYTELSQTFLLFGDPAMVLQVPLPRRPGGLSAQLTATNTVELGWNSALDSNGAAAAGYHLYRGTTAGGPYTRLNAGPLAATAYSDGAISVGATYYYVVAALDGDGDESVPSEPAGVVLTDSDSDGLYDLLEAAGCTAANLPDSDGDGLTDGTEDANRNGTVDAGETDPCDSDSDGDGLPDGWEAAHGLDPVSGSGAGGPDGDPDNDGWTNYQEYLSCTDPADAASVPGAPTVPALNYPANGDETATRQPWLSVSNAEDADCQALRYVFELYADALLTTLVAATAAGGAAEDDNTTAWQAGSLLNENAGYYWRARAYDGISYSDWMAMATFFVNTTPEAPTVPTVSAPPDASEVAVVQPTLEVANAADADRDALTYEFRVYADDNLAALVSSKSDVLQDANGTTAWQVAALLEDNTHYWWVVQATDDDGLAGGWNSAVRFFVNTANDAPTTPPGGSPADGAEVATTTPLLAVDQAADADLDALSYFFEIDLVDTFNGFELEQSAARAQQAGETTSWTPLELTDNSTYYWRVRAFDGLTYGPWHSGSFFVNTANDAPGGPTIDHPGDQSNVTTRQPTLAVKAAVDADLDALDYDFELYADPDLTDPVAAVDGADVAWQVDETLTDNRSYFWRARAVDAHGAAGDWSATVSFFVNTANDPPPAPVLNNPVSGGTDTSLTPILSVFNAADLDQDALSYEFELYADADLSRLVSAATAAQGHQITSWSVSSALADGGIYYWRARAHDGQQPGSWMPTAVLEIHSAGTDTQYEIASRREIFARSLEPQDVAVAAADSPIFNTSVEVPPGALRDDCTILIGPVTNPPALPRNTRAVGRVTEFGPSGMTFNVPVVIKLPYTAAALRQARVVDPAELAVFYYDTSILAWAAVEIAGIDSINQLVSIETRHFSMYTIGASVAEAASGGGGGGVCFIAAMARAEAAVFKTDWPGSSILGLLALFGLLWLGRKKERTED